MLFPGEKLFNSLLRDCLISFYMLFSWEKGFVPLLRGLSHSFYMLFPGEKALIPLLRDCLIYFTYSFSWRKAFNSSPSVTVSFILQALSWRKALIPLLRDCLIHCLIRDCLIHFTCSFLEKGLNSSFVLSHSFTCSFLKANSFVMSHSFYMFFPGALIPNDCLILIPVLIPSFVTLQHSFCALSGEKLWCSFPQRDRLIHLWMSFLLENFNSPLLRIVSFILLLFPGENFNSSLSLSPFRDCLIHFMLFPGKLNFLSLLRIVSHSFLSFLEGFNSLSL
ncbi:unnamed protein product [Acanthosepion pharaonis]|uniref:Uncharacterized protein n=1 Tax=Acanthosepion pharaonis TaxID=158019 RepID=A0A812CJG2_ACAPH|nr:unnamed protein product [Sepia pharaonis]